MKKVICAVMLLIVGFMSISADAELPQNNWYIKHTGTHEKPVCDRRFAYIDGYNAYYLDPNSNEENRILYLTFDAGYENGNIKKILDILKQEKVPAAFFVLDNLIYKNADLLKRMQQEGHLVCNHTTKHRDMSVTTEEEFKSEIQKMENLYQERIGTSMAKYYRPPEGKFVEENLIWAQDLDYTTVLWSFAYPDWDNANQPSPERAKEKIIKNTHPGEILLLHPNSETNAEILQELIREWRQMGYRFGTLDELSKAK